jgi:hypothetical protein
VNETIRDGQWFAHGDWVAEYCAEQPEEPEPLFRVQPEANAANAATVAGIHNALLAEVERLVAAVRRLRAAVRQSYDAVDWDSDGYNPGAARAILRDALKDAES